MFCLVMRIRLVLCVVCQDLFYAILSSGEVRVFSQNGVLLCHIGDGKVCDGTITAEQLYLCYVQAVEENDLSQAVAGISFIPCSAHHTSK